MRNRPWRIWTRLPCTITVLAIPVPSLQGWAARGVGEMSPSGGGDNKDNSSSNNNQHRQPSCCGWWRCWGGDTQVVQVSLYTLIIAASLHRHCTVTAPSLHHHRQGGIPGISTELTRSSISYDDYVLDGVSAQEHRDAAVRRCCERESQRKSREHTVNYI